MTAEAVAAPWTDEQVENINGWQRAGHVHPLTCGHCRDELGTHFIRLDGDDLVPAPDDIDLLRRTPVENIVVIDRILVATNDGLVCETCDYVQTWVFPQMVNPPPASPFKALAR